MKKITVEIPASELRKVSSKSIYHLEAFVKSKGIDTSREYRIWRAMTGNIFEVRGYPIKR